MLRASRALLLALCCVTAVSCSGDGTSSERGGQGASGDVLEGADLGSARGSKEEVPFDDSDVDEGSQPGLDSPAVVLVPSDSGEEVITARVTLQSAEQVDVADLQIQGIPKAELGAVTAYVVEYRMEYVTGPVLRDFQSVYFDLVSGEEIVSDDYQDFAAAVDCATFYSVENFGKGAVLQGCEVLLVGPDRPQPDAVAWTAPIADDDSSIQVGWPLQ